MPCRSMKPGGMPFPDSIVDFDYRIKYLSFASLIEGVVLSDVRMTE
jgi:hypothetical protein